MNELAIIDKAEVQITLLGAVRKRVEILRTCCVNKRGIFREGNNTKHNARVMKER